MTKDISGWVLVCAVAVTLILLLSGWMMVSEPPSAADAAVGKGLLVLGLCGAVVTASLLTFAARAEAPSR